MILGQVVLPPERRTNDSHAILINQISDLRKELIAVMQADWTGALIDRLNEFARENSHSFGEVRTGEDASVLIQQIHGCYNRLYHELAAAQAEIAHLEQLLSGKPISPASGPTSNSANSSPVETQ